MLKGKHNKLCFLLFSLITSSMHSFRCSEGSFVKSEVRYSNGLQRILVRDVALVNNLSLSCDHIEFVVGSHAIREWMKENDTDPHASFSEKQELELASLLAEEIKLREPHKAGQCEKWTLVSSIYRHQDPTGTKSYTNTVHRDLSEDAVNNLQAHDNQIYYYNAWIPRNKVTSFPLGLILPDSVNLRKEPNGFLGLEHDKTGIDYSTHHNWIFHSALDVGDAILWHSEIVYHAAFATPNQQVPRNSVDFRIYFHNPEEQFSRESPP